MDSLIFAINAVAPIILMVVIGYLLKKKGFMSADFARAANKLVFRIFLPSMLFLNVYKIGDIGEVKLGYIFYVVAVLIALFAVALPLVIATTKHSDRRGALLQAVFRSNYALIGIPLAQSLCGDDGVAIATLLSVVSIPLLNILAVISLSLFREDGGKPSVKKILLDIAKNPLILSVLIGLAALGVRALFVHYGVEFRLSDVKPLYSVLTYLSNLATPMALLVLGAQFEFSAVSSLRREIVFGTVARTVVVPILGIGVAFLFFRGVFVGAHFAAFVAMFCTPVAVSSVPMAQEMKADAALAGQLVVWSTVISAFTVFLAAFLLRLAGIFG